MNIMFFNAQGLTRKAEELNDLLNEDDIDIACISETYLLQIRLIFHSQIIQVLETIGVHI